MRMNYWWMVFVEAMLAASFIFPPVAVASNLEKDAVVKELVERFCRAEFEGVQDIRLGIVKFSAARKVQEEKRDSQFRGFVKTWEIDPLVVVASYRIINITVQDDSAIAKISYERLMRTEGDLGKRHLIKDYNAEDIVKLNLVYRDKRWWIIDPPFPRISREAIVTYYRGKLDRTKAILHNPKTSEEQKQSYRKLKDDLTILEEK